MHSSAAMSGCKGMCKKVWLPLPLHSKQFTIDEVLKTLHVVQTSFDDYFEDLIEYR